MQEITKQILKEKYLKGNEKHINDVRERVAFALADVEGEGKAITYRLPFYNALKRGFIPAGRINSAAGTGIQATLLNCFVQPVGDSMIGYENGKPGIMVAVEQASETMRRGGGVGYDFSRIRPIGAKVKGTHSSASGPLSYMRVFDAMCQTVESAGARRGAQMGILRCDHPDIEAFVAAKAKPYTEKELSQFNISVAVTDSFMQAVKGNKPFDLVHPAEPGDDLIAQGAYQRDDGLWVYRRINARELWEKIMQSTYDFADPGVVFIDRMNEENNLAYCESIEATNPCGEQPLPDYGCCCLGSINLVEMVKNPFTPDAYLDVKRLGETVHYAVRMLDNTLDLTVWPLDEQRKEAHAKRRIGLGVTGLADALLMMGLKYDSEDARRWAGNTLRMIRDVAYEASVDIAKEKGAFPMFDAEAYLKSPFIKRLPVHLRDAIRKHGIRNSHLLSIAPTGTISIAFGDNCSSGIEPVFSWFYDRKVRQSDGTHKTYRVYDKGYLMFKEHAGIEDDEEAMASMPEHFVTAHEISAEDHAAMVAAIAPYCDSAISKTVNVPEDYPYEDFKDLYMKAWEKGLKGITTYRPNSQVDSVLSVSDDKPAVDETQPDDSDPDRRVVLKELPESPTTTLRWPKRPTSVYGNPSWTFVTNTPHGKFATVVGHIENGHNHPFEVWVNGSDQPRGLGALAKSLSMDMRSEDRAWLQMKLDAIQKVVEGDAFPVSLGDNPPFMAGGAVAAFARIVAYRCEQLGAFDHDNDTPVVDALMSPKEPKTGETGTLSWTVDVKNPNTGDDFLLIVKELELPNGQRRPYSVWMAGSYPKAMDGLMKSLSFDLRVMDVAWVGMKLRQLLDYYEPQGDFMAKDPATSKGKLWPSTAAYIARLVQFRLQRLGLLDADGNAVETGMTIEESTAPDVPTNAVAGKPCPECNSHTVIRRDGCDFCTSCGWVGHCG